MKNFKKYLSEAENKPPTASQQTGERHKREKEQLQVKQQRELERARAADFRKKEAEKKRQELQKRAEKQVKEEDESNQPSETELTFGEDASEIYEYLEDGTLKLVQSYKKEVPGQ